MERDILDALHDLHKQATEERSHYYVGRTCEWASLEIARLRAALVSERERCAKIAETAPAECLQMWDRPGGPPGNGWRKTTGADIAALIRRSDEQTPDRRG